MEVEAVAALLEDAVIANRPTWLITSQSDPFAAAYEQALVFGDAEDGAGRLTESGGGLSPGWIAALAAAAVAVGLCCGALLWALRQRAGRGQGSGAVVVESKAVEALQDADRERDVEPAQEVAGPSDGKVVV